MASFPCTRRRKRAPAEGQARRRGNWLVSWDSLKDEAYRAERSQLHGVQNRFSFCNEKASLNGPQLVAITADVLAHVVVAAEAVDDEVGLDAQRIAAGDAHVGDHAPGAR